MLTWPLHLRANTTTVALTMSIFVIKMDVFFANCEKNLGILSDLSRAFDLVDHNILLDKLRYYDIRGIANDWFRSYLTNRLQQVEVDG